MILSQNDFMHCLVTFDNRRNIDLFPDINTIPTPIVLRSLVKLAVSSGTSVDHTLGPASLTARYITRSLFYNDINCPFSTFYLHAGYQNFICYKLDFSSYWRHTKSWDCHLQITLFPDIYYYKCLCKHISDTFDNSTLNSYQYILKTDFSKQAQIFVQEIISA